MWYRSKFLLAVIALNLLGMANPSHATLTADTAVHEHNNDK